MAGKIVPELAEQSAPIQDADLLVSYRGSGPLKRFAASVLKAYAQAGTVLTSVLAASGGSALVGFLQAGTGAVATTVQADFRLRSVTLEQYGAVGDSTSTGGGTDDTAAFLAAIVYLSSLSGGGEIVLGRKFYRKTASVDIDPGFTKSIVIRGQGQGSGIYNDTTADAFRLGETAFLKGSGFYDFTLTGSVTSGHLVLVGTQGIVGFTSHSVQYAQSNPAKSILTNGSTFGQMYDSIWSGGDWNVNPSLSSVSGVKWVANGTTFNENTFCNFRAYNAKGAPFFDISNSNAGTWLTNNVLRSINFEICAAGAVKVANARGWKLSNLSFWDVAGPYTGHIIHLATNAGLESAANTLEICQRHGDTLTAGKYDIYIEGGQDTLVSQCYTADSPAYNWNSKRVTVVGRMAGQINALSRDQILPGENIFSRIGFGSATGTEASAAFVAGGYLQFIPQVNDTGVIFGARSSGGVETKLVFASDGGALFPLTDNKVSLGINTLAYKDVTVSVGYYVNASKVVGARDTGWTAGTGTANKGAFAAYAGATMSVAYVQAEAQATNDAAKNASQRIKAIEDALRAHGLIN